MNEHAVQEFVSKHEIKTVRLVFADQNAITRGKSVPADVFLENLASGFGFATSIFAMDVEGETIPETGLLWERGDPDFIARPDLATLTLVPWKPHTAQVIVDAFTQQDEPFFAAPRNLLKRVLARLAKAGYQAKVASELEFYLLHGDTLAPTTEGLQAYSIANLVETEKPIEAVERHAQAMGIPLEALLSEYAPGQFEINLRYDAALAMADRTFLFRNMVKETARQLGYHVTFMAKPFAESAGSSFHLHVSLWKAGENVFAFSEPNPTALPKSLLHFIGGCQKYLNPAAAFFAPTINAYKRLRPGSYAPVNDSWGVDNRTVSLRIPPAHGNACRLEIRIPGADANPYLVIATALVIGWLGMQEQIEPKAAVEGNAYALPATLPRDLQASLEALAGCSKLVDWLGADFIHVYSAVKRAEWRKYISTITEWERGKYFKLL
ncbi:MAG: glutamine synthetase family protein [candidate division KSB1 bacterium]|nr:glutamine synthetase family protein [candidate division KSB1 bacterium]